MNTIDLSEKEEKLVIKLFAELKTERSKYITRWKDVQNYVAISNEINTEFEQSKSENEQKDIFINDATAFTSVYQAGDYLAGILWNSNAVTIEPSKYIKDQIDNAEISDFYKKATKVFLEQMNSTDAGFLSVLKSYCYEQFSYGTSGIGTFKSKEFEKGQSECCLSFKSFGVWNSCIDEGSNNKIDIVYTIYNWRVNQIVEEFCYDEGKFSQEFFDELPEDIKQAAENKEFNKKFKLVFAVMPNDLYLIGKSGKVGAKFKGYWFSDTSEQKIFKVVYFKNMPIAMCRAIRVNNQVYGESSGTLAISSIKMINYIKGNTVDNIEKTTDPALGIISGALVAGNVFNRSAGAINTFNPQAVANGQIPIFPIAQAGDISAVVNFLIPELKKDIVNIFKIDQLLDFNNQTQMTATESAMRMSIRGKSLNGLLSQQKSEEVEPTCHRAISIIADCGLFGKKYSEVMELPETTDEELALKEKLLNEKDFIPEVVEKAMNDGKQWYTLKFNGELEKLANAELYEAFGKFLQYLSAALQIKPEIIHAINSYELLDFLKSISNLVNDNLIKNKYDYDEIIKTIQEQSKQQAQQQEMLAQSQALKNLAGAQKDDVQAQMIGGNYEQQQQQ